MNRMRALVKEGREVTVRQVPPPRVVAADDVIISVVAAGMCRTDLYAAQGLIATSDPVILGHELSGVISEVGPAVRGLLPGDRVTVFPLVPCGGCARCASGPSAGLLGCRSPMMLGVSRHGAFAEMIGVPAAVVHRLPDSVSFRAGAYCEPLAAALAVLRAGLPRTGRGLIYGDNRIAALTHRVMLAHGYSAVAVHRPGEGPAERDGYDFVIETQATQAALSEIIAAVRPGGRIVLKSRPAQPVPVDLAAAVHKELSLCAVRYGSMAEAIAHLAERRIEVDDLLGESFELDSFEQVFAAAGRDEKAKLFFSLGPR